MDEMALEEEELVRELLNDKSPFILLPTCSESEPEPEPEREREVRSEFGQSLSRVLYSRITIEDIENALSVSHRNCLPWSRSGSTAAASIAASNSSIKHDSGGNTANNGFRSTFSFLDKGLEKSKMENKYSLRIKSCGNGNVDDGYKWRKYGRKTIKNSPNPRSYYKCTNPRCSAKKRVEISPEDPETLVITYEGLHLHYTYPYLQLRQSSLGQPTEPNKRPRLSRAEPMVGPLEESPLIPDHHNQPPQPNPNCPNSFAKSPALPTLTPSSPAQPPTLGLLQDIVPLSIMNPMKSPKCPHDRLPSSLLPSSSPPLSTSSPSTSILSSFPTSSCSPSSSSSWFSSGSYDMGILYTK